jgi:subtilisin family serine protease
MPHPLRSRRRILPLLVGAVLLGGPAAAQILDGAPPGLPAVGPLPLPGVDRPLGEVGRLANGAADLGGRTLAGLRTAAARALLREHRDLIEADDHGEPVVRGEVVITSPTDQNLAAARQAGFEIAEDARLEGLDLRVVTLKVPRGESARAAVARLRRLDPQGRWDFNHLYLAAGAVGGPAGRDAAPASGSGRGARIGLVDGAVAAHPSLASAVVEQRAFAPGGLRASPHATAVASLLAGDAGAFHGAAPGARLLVADVYGGSPVGGSAVLIAKALAWLGQAGVPVINISLVGPPNATLQAAVAALTARGVLITAAVGNDGPAAPPLYPASYPGVVSVTGVDQRRRVLPEAGRRGHVDFAAPGADLAGASDRGGYVILRGTSFAAPIVAGRLALGLDRPDPAAARAALAGLAREAQDLGAPGPEPVYGKGLVGDGVRVAPAVVKASRLLASNP